MDNISLNMNIDDYINNKYNLASCYENGLPRECFPLCIISDKKYLYKKEWDEITQELSEGFYTTDRWCDCPFPVSSEEQKAIDNYFFTRNQKAFNYVKEMGWKGAKLVSIFPVVTYELLPHSINVLEDGRRVTNIIELWDDEPPALCIAEVDKDDTLMLYGRNNFHNSVIEIIKQRIFQSYVNRITSSSEARYFNLYIPKIHSQFGEMEKIDNVFCGWKRIKRIANYYCKWGLSTISLGKTIIWAGYKHKSLPIPFKKDDIQKAAKEWDKMVYDNPFGEHTFFENSNLNKWDYEILEKARNRQLPF